MSLARTLRDAYNAVDPTKPLPAGDPRYVNCNDVRGNEDIVAQMFRAISFSDQQTCQLFTGHRGCGKSTELLRLKKRLEDDGFYVVYYDVNEVLDPNDLTYTDLLLWTARQVEADFREQGIPLERPLKALERWFAEVVYQQDEWRSMERQLTAEVSLGAGLPPDLPLVARLLAKLTGQIKTGDTVKTEIRQRLDRQVSQLIVLLNDLLNTAQVQVTRRNRSDIVVIVDSLDRIPPQELGSGRTSHDALYIEHGDQLRALACHTIYTVPISMLYTPRANILRNIFPDKRVLPMIKAHEPVNEGGGDWPDGIARLRSLLGERIEIDALAEKSAVDYLCRASGGHPRDLMTLVRHSIEYADEGKAKPITLTAAQRAEARLIAAFSRSIPEAHFRRLARVHLTNRIENDPDHQLMLYNNSVLEYANGAEPWHDVHPAVLKLRRFKEALTDERPDLAGRA
ncbi:MAG: AAA family ATPase [Acidobacteria bacterium]|nr:AAA family ATPase [Acidobacteriota bacterium]